MKFGKSEYAQQRCEAECRAGKRVLMYDANGPKEPYMDGDEVKWRRVDLGNGSTFTFVSISEQARLFDVAQFKESQCHKITWVEG